MDAGEDAGAAPPCSPEDPREREPDAFVGPGGLRDRLVGAMDGAEARLLVATYLLDDPAVVDALAAAAGRGVAVRLLVDGAREENAPALERLGAGGVQVRAASPMFRHFHPKYLVIDGVRAVVMSANLNGYSMATERNHGVALTDARDVADLESLFELDWGGTPATWSCTRLVLSPNDSREKMEALLDRAAGRLDLQHLSLSDEGMRARIAAAQARGVAVRVLLADPAWITGNTESAAVLRGAGAEVRFLRALDNHAKLVLADDEAYVGSLNLSWTALEQNREVGILTDASAPVEILRASFESDWARGEP